MLTLTRQGGVKNVVVFRIDRLGRNSREVLMLFDEFERRGVQIYSLHEQYDSTTPHGRFMRLILVGLAELERENIAEATRQRLSALKALGRKLGRREREFNVEEAVKLRKQGTSWAAIARIVHCPASTVRLRLSNSNLQQTPPEKPAVVGIGENPPLQDSAIPANP